MGAPDSGVTIDEYQQHDAVGLAELLRRGEMTPLELLRVAVSQKEIVNPALNAVSSSLTVFAGQSIDDGLPRGPFHGVPFLLKDQIDLAEVPTGRACRLLLGKVPQ